MRSLLKNLAWSVGTAGALFILSLPKADVFSFGARALFALGSGAAMFAYLAALTAWDASRNPSEGADGDADV